MFHYLASFAASVAAAVTGTETPETHAAGCRFGPEPTQPATRARRPLPVWRFEITTTEGMAAGVGTISARDSRAALRAFARMIRGARTYCGPDGPAVAVGGVETAAGDPQFRTLRGPDGVACGIVRIMRADGRPMRCRKGAGR